MGLKVLWPYVTIKVTNDQGQVVLREFYAGAPVPDSADPDDRDRLVRKGALVEDGTLAGDVLAVPAGTPIPGEPPNVPVTEQPVIAGNIDERMRRVAEAAEKAAAKAAEGEPETDLPPAQSAPKPDWVAYAVSQRDEGVSEEDARAEAEAKTKSELIVEYGG